MNARGVRLPAFQAPYARPDEELAAVFVAQAERDSTAESRIDARARKLVEAIRAKAHGLGGVEDFLHAYSLSTKEGLALMVLAEALLRVPDAATADRLIEDKLAAGRWLDSDIKSSAILVSASAWTLGIAARLIHPGETPETILDAVVPSPRPAGHARGDAAGHAAHRLAFRARPNYRGGVGARPQPFRCPLLVRHAGRRGAHRRRCREILSRICGRDRGDRRSRRQRAAAGAARHFG